MEARKTRSVQGWKETERNTQRNDQKGTTGILQEAEKEMEERRFCCMETELENKEGNLEQEKSTQEKRRYY